MSFPYKLPKTWYYQEAIRAIKIFWSHQHAAISGGLFRAQSTPVDRGGDGQKKVNKPVHKYVVLVSGAQKGVYDTYLEALNFALEHYKRDQFMIKYVVVAG